MSDLNPQIRSTIQQKRLSMVEELVGIGVLRHKADKFAHDWFEKNVEVLSLRKEVHPFELQRYDGSERNEVENHMARNAIHQIAEKAAYEGFMKITMEDPCDADMQVPFPKFDKKQKMCVRYYDVLFLRFEK